MNKYNHTYKHTIITTIQMILWRLSRTARSRWSATWRAAYLCVYIYIYIYTHTYTYTHTYAYIHSTYIYIYNTF